MRSRPVRQGRGWPGEADAEQGFEALPEKSLGDPVHEGGLRARWGGGRPACVAFTAGRRTTSPTAAARLPHHLQDGLDHGLRLIVLNEMTAPVHDL